MLLTTKQQVQKILHKEGYSFTFTETDYRFFRRKAGNDAYAIAEMFKSNCTQPSDLEDYVY